MTYSKLGNIKGPQGRRGLNMTGGATTPPAVDDSVLEGDLWLDSTTGDVYRATTPDPAWAKDDTWHTWGTVLWKVADNTLMAQPAEGGTGTLGTTAVWSDDGWGNSSSNPSMASITSVRSKETIAMNARNAYLFQDYTSLTDISALSGWDISGVTSTEGMFSGCSALTDLSPLSGWDVSNVTSTEGMFGGCSALTDLSPLSGWDVSGVTDMTYLFTSCSALVDLSPLSGWNTSGVASMETMFHQCTSLTDISALSGWDTSRVSRMSTTFANCTSLTDASAISGWNISSGTSMNNMFSNCPLERIGVPSLDHGGKNFVSNLNTASAVASMDTTMLTNTTTHETMSANQILTDMDSNPSKYSTGTVWTIARA